MMDLSNYYSQLYRIRTFEERLLELFGQGHLRGTTHTYIGQEANAVGVISHLRPDDYVVSNHRCHGHYIAFKGNSYGLLCELMGKEDGVCAGRGGSQHLCDGTFFTNGIQGGIVPLATGLAFGAKRQETGQISVVFIGDGTLGEGVVYESLNIASKWQLPLLVVVENNQYAQSTPIHLTLAGDIAKRFEAFDIETTVMHSFDVQEIGSKAQTVIEDVRTSSFPRCLVLNTYRFASHSKSDDGRDPAEVERMRQHDCLKIAEKNLPAAEVASIRSSIDDELRLLVQQALAA